MARSPTILLVEDDPNDVMLVRRAVQKTLAGIPVQVVGNGEEAIRYLSGTHAYSDRKEHPLPDLVLLDLKMPLVDGFEVLQWLRIQPGIRRVPVVVFTGSNQESDTRRAYEYGANSYIIKPGDFAGMLDTIKNLGDFWLVRTKLPESS
jgi:CheY-like chemotaxis protein